MIQAEIPAKAASSSDAPPQIKTIVIEGRVRLDWTFESGRSSRPFSATHFNSNARSLAVCQRSSRSLAKQRRIARSSVGGVRGLTELMAGGPRSQIPLATLHRLFPSNPHLHHP